LSSPRFSSSLQHCSIDSIWGRPFPVRAALSIKPKICFHGTNVCVLGDCRVCEGGAHPESPRLVPAGKLPGGAGLPGPRAAQRASALQAASAAGALANITKSSAEALFRRWGRSSGFTVSFPRSRQCKPWGLTPEVPGCFLPGRHTRIGRSGLEAQHRRFMPRLRLPRLPRKGAAAAC
jgi:hypothetical protein